MPEGIADVARQGIVLIEDHALRHALDAVYLSVKGIEAAKTAQRVFDCLVSSTWPSSTLCRFLSGWRSTHLTTTFVSGLVIRMLRKACLASGHSRDLHFRAAGAIGE